MVSPKADKLFGLCSRWPRLRNLAGLLVSVSMFALRQNVTLTEHFLHIPFLQHTARLNMSLRFTPPLSNTERD